MHCERPMKTQERWLVRGLATCSLSDEGSLKEGTSVSALGLSGSGLIRLVRIRCSRESRVLCGRAGGIWSMERNGC